MEHTTPSPASDETETVRAPASNAGFGFLLVATLVLVAGIVYVVGVRSQAAQRTADAQERAEEQLADFDGSGVADEVLPDELALTETTVPPAAAASPTSAPSTTEIPEATTSTAVAQTVEPEAAAGTGIDPSTIAVAFVDRTPGENWGRAGYIDVDGQRRLTDLRCDRLALNRKGGLCLGAEEGLGGTGTGYLIDAAFNTGTEFPLNRPSRAAVSPDGEVVAWTGFTLGHSYLMPGEFATITQVISVQREVAANLETQFVTVLDGQLYENSTRNFWGVTFVDSDHFYATMGVADGTTSIVEGRISSSRLDIRFEDASCPEVSPDGSTVVAKSMRHENFRLIAIDTETGDRFELGETRMVDDQVEWIDEDTVVYALPNDAGTVAQPSFDVWALDVEPGAQPRLLIPFASSPAT